MYMQSTMPLIHREGLLKLINDGIDKIPATWKELVPNVIKSKQSFEEIQTHAGLGFFQTMDEAEGVSYDAVVPRYTKRYTPVIRTLGIKHSRQSAQKDLYGFVKSQAPMLAESAVATMNLLAANIYNLGFGGGTTSPDGVALFSTAHPLANGLPNESNLITQALSGLSLENALQIAMSHKGERGIPKYYRGGFKLAVGPGLAGIATRAVESVGLQGTSDNDTNAFVKGMVKGVIVDQLIGFGQPVLSQNWFLLPADAKDNQAFCLEAQGVSTDTDYDMDYQVTKFAASFEVVFDVLGWRGFVGSLLG